MRTGLFVLVAACAAVGSIHSTASAIDAPLPPTPAESLVTDRVPVTGPYNLFTGGTPMTGPEAILYSNTIETGSRFNPGPGGTTASPGTQQDITFDDIPIPNARLGGATAVDVTKVTVGIRRAGTAPATDVNLFWATATTNVTDPDTELDVPFTPIGTRSLAPRAAAAFTTELVVFGDGSTTLFTAPLNSTLFNGFGSFMLGLQFSSADTNNGWRLTSGADSNGDVMWIYDTDVTPNEGAFEFGPAPQPNATFYIVVEGTPVPEPASLGLVGALGLMALRRRRA